MATLLEPPTLILCFPGTSIAACNSSSRLRVYMQDVLGKIRESKYEDKWSNGTEKNVIASAKSYSPVACASSGLDNVNFPKERLPKEKRLTGKG